MGRQPLVVLVYPGKTDKWSAQPWCDMPLELLAVASPLARKGYEVRIIDQRIQRDWRGQLETALREGPVLVGVTSTTGPQLRHALEVSRLVKQHGETPVVWGGIHATLLPRQTLERPEIDFVVLGEGERSLEELVEKLQAGSPTDGIAGVWTKSSSQPPPCREFIDLNQEPFLHYDLVDVPRYVRTVFGVKRLSFSTSRGCVFPCAFCYSTVVHRRRWRALRADVALEQMTEFTRRYGVKGLFLTDANFFVDLDRARSILEGVVRKNLGLVFTRLHIRFDTLRRLTAEDLDLIARAGCKCLALGVESGSPRIRNLLHKPVDEGDLLEQNRRLRDFPIVPLYFFMVGFPTETVQELQATVNLFLRLTDENPRAAKSVNVYCPFPGTELFELAVAEGFRPPSEMEGWFDFSYRFPGAGGCWLQKGMRERIEMLDFCSFFVGAGGYATPFKGTSRLAKAAAKLYAPVARLRLRRMLHHFPIEARLARRLGVYAG